MRTYGTDKYHPANDKSRSRIMKTSRNGPAVTASLATMAYLACSPPSFGQQPPLPGEPGFGELLVKAAKESPGFLGIETGRTASGTMVIFAWFEGKKAIVDWYKSDFHQRAMKSAFPNQTFDRQPLPDVPEGSGPILALVTLKLADAAPTAASPVPIEKIGIELYTPLPDGVAVGGRFAPKTVKVPGLREIDLKTATGGPR
jgi:hypothetical protein